VSQVSRSLRIGHVDDRRPVAFVHPGDGIR
jgi:hypothetical protein